MKNFDFEEVAIIAVGTALGLVLGKMLAGYMSTTEFGAKLGMSGEGFEENEPKLATI